MLLNKFLHFSFCYVGGLWGGAHILLSLS